MNDLKKYYPVNLDLEGKPVVVVGGGKVAERKVEALLEAEADVTLISPDITEGLKQLAAIAAIVWRQKEVSPEDLLPAAIVIAATNEGTTNAEVNKMAKPHQLVNLVDNQKDSDFHTPSVIRRGGLVITVSTSGASPILSKKISREIADCYDESYEDYLEFLFACRERIVKEVKDPKKKRHLLAALVEQDFLREGDRHAAFQILYENIMKS